MSNEHDAVEHSFSLTYTNSDDGIWLDCSCGKSMNVGYFPSLELVVLTAEEHRNGE